jgi:hypothetical protein
MVILDASVHELKRIEDIALASIRYSEQLSQKLQNHINAGECDGR